MDRVLVECFVGGIVIQLVQHALGARDRIGITSTHPEHIAAVGDLHAHPQLDHAQVRIERT